MSNKGHRQTDRQTDGPNNRDTQQAGRRDTETKWQKQRYRQTDRPNKLRDTETQRVAEIKDMQAGRRDTETKWQKQKIETDRQKDR